MCRLSGGEQGTSSPGTQHDGSNWENYNQRWQSCRANDSFMGRQTGVNGEDELGIRVGGRREGQSVWTTQIKRVGVWDGAVSRGDVQKDEAGNIPALPVTIHGLTWKFNLIALLMPLDCIVKAWRPPFHSPFPFAPVVGMLVYKNQSSQCAIISNSVLFMFEEFLSHYLQGHRLCTYTAEQEHWQGIGNGKNEYLS